MKKILPYSFILGVAFLSFISCNHNNTEENQNSGGQDGADCSATQKCPGGFSCYQGFCRAICGADTDCLPDRECRDDVCLLVKNPECHAHNDCTTPGSCQKLAATGTGTCTAGICRYSAVLDSDNEDTRRCNDQNPCTLNDMCQDGSCRGTPKVCDTPPGNICVENNSVYRNYNPIGTCQAESGECQYAYDDDECPNCELRCAGFCENVTCNQEENSCRIFKCDPDSAADPPCSPRNIEDGATCASGEETSVLNGTCKSGLCLKNNGLTCESGAECASGYCVDGVCCESACDGTCMACNLPSALGTCSPTPAGEKDTGTCEHINEACDGQGGCKTAQGKSCSADNECVTGHCVDYVCCEGAACETCMACNLNGQGTCSLVANGQEDSDSCTGGHKCNGQGTCLKLGGESCTYGSECIGGYCKMSGTASGSICCDTDCAHVPECSNNTPIHEYCNASGTGCYRKIDNEQCHAPLNCVVGKGCCYGYGC